MAVSEERIAELFDLMLANADKDGWCHIPDGLSDEESEELARRIAIMTMEDRIDSLLEGIDDVTSFINDMTNKLDDLEVLEKIKLKANLDIIKEDSQTILIDLHSDDKISDFFRIDLISFDDEESKKNKEQTVTDMNELIETRFKASLENIKERCQTLISNADELLNKLG